MPLKLLVLAAAIMTISGATVAHAAQPLTQEANNSVQYIESLQNADGGFPAFGSESTAGSTIDAIFALKAAGVDVDSVTSAHGMTPIDYLARQSATYSNDAGGLAKLILCVRLVGGDVTDFGGVDLLSEIDGHFDDVNGTFGDDNFDQALFILAGETFQPSPQATRLAAAVARLRAQQQSDGGWEFAAGQGSDSNTTAMTLQALLAFDPQATSIGRGLQYLESVQNEDGGFGFLAGADSDPNSTALVIQALIAADAQGYPESIDPGGPWDRGGHTPLKHGLMLFYSDEFGAFLYGDSISPFATYQAVPALMLAPFPALETVRDEDGPTLTGTPSAIPDLVAPATPTPVIGLPPAGTGERDAVVWPLVAALGAIGVLALGGAIVRRRA